MTMSVEPLSPALGAEIKGVDLRRPLDDATVRAINAAFDEHVVVVFRDQELSEADQMRAAGYFGKVHIRRRPANGRTPGGDYDTPFMMVTNIVENGKSAGAFGDGEMWFHHDTSYYPQPHRATFLYSMHLTSRGELEKILHHEQPIIITHPATGKKALYVSRLMSARIEGFSPQDSEAALAQLFDIAEDPAIVYEHEWRLGDLVVWDNWCSIHARKDFPREEPRLMRRCTIEGQALRY